MFTLLVYAFFLTFFLFCKFAQQFHIGFTLFGHPVCGKTQHVLFILTRALLAVSHVGSTALRVTVPAVMTCGIMAPYCPSSL